MKSHDNPPVKVSFELSGELLSRIDHDRKGLERTTFIKQVLCGYFHISGPTYHPKQAWRLLTHEERALRETSVVSLKLAGLSQVDIAKKCELSPGRVFQILVKHGYVPRPTRKRQ